MMRPAPLVSVLMPVFNCARYLREALQSVSAQTLAEFELIVIDDGSADDSARIAAEYAAREPRLKLIRRSNRGLVATRNELLALASGPLIAWMDADDISLPDRLTAQHQRFAQNPNLICLGSAARCIDPRGRSINVERYPLGHAQIVEQQQRGGGMRFPTTMMRRLCALTAGGFREPFRIGEDFDLLLRLGEAGELENLGAVHYLYRQHPHSTSARLSEDWPGYRDCILALARQRLERGSDELQLGRSIRIETRPRDGGPRDDGADAAWKAYLSWASAALEDLNWSAALRYVVATIIRKPHSVRGWRIAARIMRRRYRSYRGVHST